VKSPQQIPVEQHSATHVLRLVSEVLAKDRKATAEFVAICADCVYGFVFRRLNPRADLVEDFMQEILLAAWQGLPGFRGDSSLRHWLLGIARHKLEDYYRKVIREALVQEDDGFYMEAATNPEYEQKFDAKHREEHVQRTLAGLPDHYSAVLLWRYRDDRSVQEMAQLTGKTEKAVERLLARARDSFRRRWDNAAS
jgi:RNA polymerase sigma-70 factor (ECF subfamily)